MNNNQSCWLIYKIDPNSIPCIIVECKIIDIRIIHSNIYYKIDEPVELITKDYLFESFDKCLVEFKRRLKNTKEVDLVHTMDLFKFRTEYIESISDQMSKYDMAPLNIESYNDNKRWFNLDMILELE
jgi:hypothetical protein